MYLELIASKRAFIMHFLSEKILIGIIAQFVEEKINVTGFDKISAVYTKKPRHFLTRLSILINQIFLPKMQE